MTAGWCSRTVRAAVFAAVCVVLAALGHVLMSGSSVPAWTLAAGVAATGAVGWGLAGRERGLPLVVTVVVAAQTALHSAFSLAQSTSPAPSATGFGGTASMDMGHMGQPGVDRMDMSHMDMGYADMGHADHIGHSMDGGGSASSGMLAAHLLAALLTGLWLAYGERAAFRILRAVAGWLAAPLRLPLLLPAAPDRPRPRVRRPRSDRAPSLRLLVHAITSRGPPLGTAVS
ncbi:hypothetical protein SLINC_4506 [Streptomyces lincolnensis]|uniref:Uncharacterized protein n=1 Tax=Streptomyces lincolnensis TaxID=1915 RepID=A0A1B1MDM9_STRLN|nr:hypothetical protein [Streptomyces lincolnensis]ANS66730.1 hypothetical protein SLINC_4506 [Streptomyces lincolnensis]AXG55601.1 hypothetical protein SLCG_4446 [Streptomyces lincolnensis]QMV07913.1 hypothetical protein GJU35_21090 [Streptomyces lincolnensis]